jgi:putative ABC transport system permease protein
VFTLLRTLSLGYLWKRWTRTTLLILSIALGVATLVATRALHDALKKAAREGVSPRSSQAHLVVFNGQTGLPVSVLKTLREPPVPGVRDIQPIVVGRAALPELGNKQARIMGLEISADQVRTLYESTDELKTEIDQIEWIDPPDSVAFALHLASIFAAGQSPGLVTEALAQDLGSRSTLLLRAAGQEKTVGILGRVRLREGSDLSVLGKNLVFTTLSTAGLMATPDRPETLTQVNIRLEDGTDRKKIMTALQQRIGTIGAVQTQEEYFAQYMEIAAGLELGFLLGSAGALVVGVFLIYNVLSVGVAERRHDIGILRSVGATRGQIAGLFMTEAFTLGMIGSLLGLPLGYAFAQLALYFMDQLIHELGDIAVHASNLHFSAWTLGLALLAGVGTTVVAALVPSLQAAREEPADAVRRVPLRASWLLRVLHVLSIVLLIGSGLLFTLYREHLPVRFGAFAGIVCLLFGAVVAMPLLARLVAGLLQPLTRACLGLEGRLAADNLIRSPGRTGLVIGALAATTALMLMTAGFIHSSKLAILDWIDTSIAADVFVTSGDAVTRPGGLLPMSANLAKEIEAIPGVAAAVPVHFHGIEFRNRLVVLLVVDLEALRGKGLQHDPARDVERNPGLLEPGNASVSQNFALLFGVQPGDTLTIPGPTGPVNLKVHGTYVDYTWNRGTILVNNRWFQETFGDRVVDVFDIYVKPGTDPETVRSAIHDRWSKSDSLFTMSRQECKHELGKQIDRVYFFAYVQQALVGLVALLGVMSAMLISVLQRRRELGLLRAVGASRAHVLRSVLAEAGVMGVIGAVIGVLVGLALEWYVVRILVPDDAGFLFPMTIPWLQLGIVAVLAILLPLLVGIWPALQATRLRIADAIAYE